MSCKIVTVALFLAQARAEEAEPDPADASIEPRDAGAASDVDTSEGIRDASMVDHLPTPDSSARDAGRCQSAPDTYAVEQRRVDHACLHTEAGPFVFIEALPASEPPPELRNTHTTFTIRLVDSPDGKHGIVRIRPRESATFAFYLGSEVPVRVSDGTGAEVCRVAGRRVQGCAKLTAIVAVPLEARRDYFVAFGPTSDSFVTVVLEAESPDEPSDAAVP